MILPELLIIVTVSVKGILDQSRASTRKLELFKESESRSSSRALVEHLLRKLKLPQAVKERSFFSSPTFKVQDAGGRGGLRL